MRKILLQCRCKSSCTRTILCFSNNCFFIYTQKFSPSHIISATIQNRNEWFISLRQKICSLCMKQQKVTLNGFILLICSEIRQVRQGQSNIMGPRKQPPDLKKTSSLELDFGLFSRFPFLLHYILFMTFLQKTILSLSLALGVCEQNMSGCNKYTF